MAVMTIILQNNVRVVPVVLIGLIAWTLFRLVRGSMRLPKMPPGPPTLPILGNAHQMPLSGVYKQYVCGFQTKSRVRR